MITLFKFLFPIFLLILTGITLTLWTSGCTNYTTYSHVLSKAGTIPFQAPSIMILNQLNEKKIFGIKDDKFVLINFFYLNCPHSCPFSLLQMRNIYKQCDNNILKNLKFLSISFDAQKDTTKRIQQFWTLQGNLSNWEIGVVRETKLILIKKLKYLGVSIKKDRLGQFNHTNFFFLLNKTGKVVQVFSPGKNVAYVLKNIKKAINYSILDF